MTPLPDGVRIEPASAARVRGWWECLDAVCRERRYLLLPEAPPFEEASRFARDFASGASPQVVAVDEATDAVVGWADVRTTTDEGFEHVGTLGMGVRSDWRRRGLGAALLEAILVRAEERGIERVQLEVFASNEGARALYRRFGFELEGRRRDARRLDGRSEDLVVMARLRTG